MRLKEIVVCLLLREFDMKKLLPILLAALFSSAAIAKDAWILHLAVQPYAAEKHAENSPHLSWWNKISYDTLESCEAERQEMSSVWQKLHSHNFEALGNAMRKGLDEEVEVLTKFSNDTATYQSAFNEGECVRIDASNIDVLASR